MRDVVLANDDLDIYAEIVFVAENFDHFAARVLRGSGPIGNLDIHDQALQIVPTSTAFHLLAQNAMAGFATLARPGRPWSFFRSGTLRNLGAPWNHDILRDLFIHGRDVVVAIAIMEGADHGGLSAEDDAYDSAFDTAVRAGTTHFDEHSVAVHRRADSRRWNEDVAAEPLPHGGVIRDDKTEAIAMHRHTANGEIAFLRSLRQRVAVSVHLHEFAAMHHL